MHLRCPHCQNPIEIADLPSGGEVTCAGCGSSFQLASLSTATWDGPTNKRLGKFEILGTVGHGAFGTVLKARHGAGPPAGKKYVIDMESPQLDTYLRLEYEQGKIVDENDDISLTNRN